MVLLKSQINKIAFLKCCGMKHSSKRARFPEWISSKCCGFKQVPSMNGFPKLGPALASSLIEQSWHPRYFHLHKKRKQHQSWLPKQGTAESSGDTKPHQWGATCFIVLRNITFLLFLSRNGIQLLHLECEYNFHTGTVDDIRNRMPDFYGKCHPSFFCAPHTTFLQVLHSKHSNKITSFRLFYI